MKCLVLPTLCQKYYWLKSMSVLAKTMYLLLFILIWKLKDKTGVSNYFLWCISKERIYPHKKITYAFTFYVILVSFQVWLFRQDIYVFFIYSKKFVGHLKSRHWGVPGEKFKDIYLSFMNLFSSYYWGCTMGQISERGTSIDTNYDKEELLLARFFNV